MKTLLEHRARVKRRKPVFVRQDTSKQKRLMNKVKWRFPRGLHSKIRRAFKGHVAKPDPGYSSPKAVRGLTPEGFEPIIIYNVSELMKIKQPFFIANGVGTKKKVAILKKAKEMGLQVLNVKHIDDFVKNVEENMKKKKEGKKLSKEKKAKAKEEALKKAEKVKKEELTEEEKKKQEKEEQNKILTEQK